MMMPKSNCIVLIVGHRDPYFLIDTAESVQFWNDVEVCFAVDASPETTACLVEQYGADYVFQTDEKNGWGRGILRTIAHAIDYFQPKFRFTHLFTMDSDALCVNSFTDQMVNLISPGVFWVGTTWYSPTDDHQHHYRLRRAGFMKQHPFRFKEDLVAGPCMLWTRECLDFMTKNGLLPGPEFDKVYPDIHFAHDQLSTYFGSCGVGRIADCSHLMELRWREALPTAPVEPWGEVPVIYAETAIIHPTVSDVYTEYNCRMYFKSCRELYNHPLF